MRDGLSMNRVTTRAHVLRRATVLSGLAGLTSVSLPADLVVV
jgi:hypothetical protein